MTEEKELGWDDALPPPQAFELLPEGDAEFEVLGIQRGRKEMGKLGICNVATATLLVAPYNPGKQQRMDVNLPLHATVVFKTYQFFASIGLYQHGDAESGKELRPDWTNAIGKTGLCVIKHRTFKKKSDPEGTATGRSHEVDCFLDEKGRSRMSDKPRAVGPTAVKEGALKF